jgi:hypothetical protein
VNERGGKLAVGIGMWLVVAGMAALVGYGVYEMLWGIFNEPDVPVLIQAAIPVCVAGAVVLLGAAFMRMMKRRKHEGLEEVEY